MDITRASIEYDRQGGTFEEDRVTYTCNKDAVTEGDTVSVCQKNGQWSVTDQNLYCRRKFSLVTFHISKYGLYCFLINIIFVFCV